MKALDIINDENLSAEDKLSLLQNLGFELEDIFDLAMYENS